LKIRQRTPSVLQLTESRFVNAYLVREDDGFTLIDTALGRAADAIASAARGAGGPIARVALTHAHTTTAAVSTSWYVCSTRSRRSISGNSTLVPSRGNP
jgi:hypothetical protein